MTATVRTLVKLVGAHLGIDATPYAARLVRDGHMQRSTAEADEFDAASLLGAILAAPVPEMAVDALDTLGDATLGPASMTADLIPIISETWSVLMTEQRAELPSTIDEVLYMVVVRSQVGDLSLSRLLVEEGGWSATARFGFVCTSGRHLSIRADYTHPDRYHRTGLAQYRELPVSVIGAVAELLASGDARPMVSVHPDARLH